MWSQVYGVHGFFIVNETLEIQNKDKDVQGTK